MSKCRTPYGRLSAKLSRQRELENAMWIARGDPRATGDAARAKMDAALKFDMRPVDPIVLELLKTIGRFFKKREARV